MRDTTKDLNTIIAAATKGEDLSKLAGRVLGLQTADKLRLAGSLLDFNKLNLALTVAKRACDEMELVLLLAKGDKPATKVDAVARTADRVTG